MKFCPACQQAMRRDSSTGTMKYRCECGTVVDGDPEDACVSSVVSGARETAAQYHILIKQAPSDRTCQLVRRDCPRCHRDYMAQIRVGDSETIVYRCKCESTSPAQTKVASASARSASQ